VKNKVESAAEWFYNNSSETVCECDKPNIRLKYVEKGFFPGFILTKFTVFITELLYEIHRLINEFGVIVAF
jgi:hypothetical protein